MLLTCITLLVPHRLLWAAIGSVGVPWLVGEAVKRSNPPRLGGSLDNGLLLVDFIVIGSIVFALSMVLTWAIGCWICSVMRGPRREADSWPADEPR
jgi:hypothetical protein